MKDVVVGLAGHIDHGKTALVKALTGIDTDRLDEEKRRGITIDLGFAHLELTPTLRIGFVDVPGHERFVKNMLAGVGGIDLALFAIAADESVKPQTREHFEICRLLGIPRGVVALTKADLVDEDLLELARIEVEELATGSFLDGAPIVPVSSVTGAGLDTLRKELARVADEARARDAAGHFRLPVDRVFSVKGFGTVVTGTLISGSVEREREVEAYPLGRRLRVRGVQVHGSKVERATAGQRTALNLADVEPAELARGVVLSEPGRFRAVRRLDCRLELLASAKPLKNRAPVHFHSGTAEIEAEVRLLEGPLKLQPGSERWARIALRDEALILPGDRFIIRSFSPVTTIGGGVVVDCGERRYRKTDDVAARLNALASGSASDRVALLVRESPFGLGMEDLVARTGMTEREIGLAAAPLRALPRKWYADRAWFDAMRAKLAATVREFHKAHPLANGMGREDLRGRLLAGGPSFLLDALIVAVPETVAEADTVRLKSHRVALKVDEERARAAIEAAFEKAGLRAPGIAETLAEAGVETARARPLLAMLLKENRVVKIGDDLALHRSALEVLRAALAARRGARFGVPEFKEWTGVSRKYAIPLLEYLDRERVTRREGNERVIL